MSTELYIPNILNRPGTEFYRNSETFKRRSAASKIRAAKYWADGRHHRRVDKKDNSYLCKPCTVDYGDGDPIRFESLKELAAAIGGTYGGVWAAMKGGRKYKGKTIKLI
jgi:hypothetical protein